MQIRDQLLRLLRIQEIAQETRAARALVDGAPARIEQIEGHWSYTRNEGSWRVSPHHGPGGRTLLRYRLAVVPRMAIPQFIVQAAQRKTAPESFEAIRVEAHKRQPGSVSAAP